MYRNLFRDRKDYVARLLLLPLFFLFILIFLGRLKSNQHSIQDRVGLLYQSATVPPFMGIINSVALCESRINGALAHTFKGFIFTYDT